MIKDFARCLEYYFEINLNSHVSMEGYKAHLLTSRLVEYSPRSGFKPFLLEYIARSKEAYAGLITGNFKTFGSAYSKLFQKIARTNNNCSFSLFESISLVFYFKVKKVVDDFVLGRLFELKRIKFEFFSVVEYLLFLLYLLDRKDAGFHCFLAVARGHVEEFAGVDMASRKFVGGLLQKTKEMKKTKTQLILWTVANVYVVMLIAAKKLKQPKKELMHSLDKIFAEMYINKKTLFRFYEENFLEKARGWKISRSNITMKPRPCSVMKNDQLLYFSLNRNNGFTRKILDSNVSGYLNKTKETRLKDTKKFSFLIKNHEKNARNKRAMSIKTLKIKQSKVKTENIGRNKKKAVKRNFRNSEANKIIERLKFSASLVKLEKKRDCYVELKNGQSVFLPLTQKIKFYPRTDSAHYFNHVLKAQPKQINRKRVARNMKKLRKIVNFIITALRFVNNKDKIFKFGSQAKLEKGVSKAKHFMNFCNLVKTRLSVTKINKLKESMVFFDDKGRKNLTGCFLSEQDLEEEYGGNRELRDRNQIRLFIRKAKYVRSKSLDLIASKVKVLNVERFLVNLDNLMSRIIKKAIFNELYCILVNYRMKQLHTNNFINRRKMTNRRELMNQIEMKRSVSSVSNDSDEERNFDFKRQGDFLRLFFGDYNKAWELNFKIEITNRVERIDYALEFKRDVRKINFFILLDDFFVKYYRKIIRKLSNLRVFLFFVNKLLYFKLNVDDFKRFDTPNVIFIDLLNNKQKNCKKMKLFNKKINFILVDHLVKEVELNTYNEEKFRREMKAVKVIRSITDMTRRLPNYHYIFNETVNLYNEQIVIPPKHRVNNFILKTLFFKDNLKLLIKSQQSFFILTYLFEKKTENERVKLSPSRIAIYNKKSSFDSDELNSSLKNLDLQFFDFFYCPLKFYEQFFNRNYKVAKEAINILNTERPPEPSNITSSLNTYIKNVSWKATLNEPLKSNQKFYINIKNGTRQNIHFSLTMAKGDSSILLLLVAYKLSNKCKEEVLPEEGNKEQDSEAEIHQPFQQQHKTQQRLQPLLALKAADVQVD